MGKYFLTDRQIKDDVEKAKKLKKEGIIVEKEIPEYWCKGENRTKSKRKLILLAVLLGFVGADRFYLKKWISAVVKTFFLSFVNVMLILAFTYFKIQNYEGTLVTMIIFAIIFYAVILGFYIGDIVISIIKPRDNEFKCVVGR